MSRHANLERFIRGAVAFQVSVAAATELPSLDTASGLGVEGNSSGQGPKLPMAEAPGSSSPKPDTPQSVN